MYSVSIKYNAPLISQSTPRAANLSLAPQPLVLPRAPAPRAPVPQPAPAGAPARPPRPAQDPLQQHAGPPPRQDQLHHGRCVRAGRQAGLRECAGQCRAGGPQGGQGHEGQEGSQGGAQCQCAGDQVRQAGGGVRPQARPVPGDLRGPAQDGAGPARQREEERQGRALGALLQAQMNAVPQRGSCHLFLSVLLDACHLLKGLIRLQLIKQSAFEDQIMATPHQFSYQFLVQISPILPALIIIFPTMPHPTRVLIFALTISLALLGSNAALLAPELIEPYMFTQVITGLPKVLIPSSTRYSGNVLAEEKYTLTMVKTSQKILPGNFSNTTVYVYSGVTSSGKVAEFPGPMIMAKKNIPIKVVWVNNIPGKHILPVDYSQPFIDSPIFRQEVPTVPHAHGIATKVSSDGEPDAYWTASGSKSKSYRTEETCNKNEAVFVYPNEQDPGLFWYHDHTMSMTRLNVYAGLAGFYIIHDNPNQPLSLAERNINQRYGTNLTTLYLTIADKSFKQNGELYYPEEADSSEYTSWVPQFYGNTITVNGKVWPLLNLEKKKYRIVLLNACQNRYLNLYFLHLGKKLPFDLVRVEGDYFQSTISTIEYFMSVGSRVEILLDLTQINGQVILKNNAAAPYPQGDVDKFTSNIFKIQTIVNEKQEKLKLLKQKVIKPKILNLESPLPVQLKEPGPYPIYAEGEKRYYVLNEVDGEDGNVVGMFIDGIGMNVSNTCEGSIFQLGKVYDVYLINLTPDTHPIHFHLVNFQKIMSHPFDVEKYTDDWFEANGGEVPKGGYTKVPSKLDPTPYFKDAPIMPKSYEKVFRDTIDAQPGEVTVIRMKFAHNNGRPFGFPVSGSRYVWHCHMLEHEDNEMMKYFCVK